MSQIIKPGSGGGGSIPGNVPESFVTDSGTAVPVGNVLNVVTPGGGTQGIKTLGSGNTITIELEPITNTATTTGMTTANIGPAIPVATNSAINIRADLVGFDKTANLATGGELIGLAKNIAGTVTIVGVPDTTKNNDTGLHDTSWTLVTSGTNVFVQVTGTANGGGADVIDWVASIVNLSAS
jgi:hypothetical protein